jgi:hypothetical protein
VPEQIVARIGESKSALARGGERVRARHGAEVNSTGI